MNQNLTKIIQNYVDLNDVIFVTSNNKKNSSDYDIYIIVQSKVKSSVHIFYMDNELYEIFIDNSIDLSTKIDNYDEIAINFLIELPFIYGDQKRYNEFKELAVKKIQNYKLPEDKKNKIRYRVKVISSKLFNPDNNSTYEQSIFLRNSLTYPLIQLILDYHSIFPSSPKRWIKQIKEKVKPDEYMEISILFDSEVDIQQLKKLIEKYSGKLLPINMDKSAENSTTFIS